MKQAKVKVAYQIHMYINYIDQERIYLNENTPGRFCDYMNLIRE